MTATYTDSELVEQLKSKSKHTITRRRNRQPMEQVEPMKTRTSILALAAILIALTVADHYTPLKPQATEATATE
jgi:hypothetical protein